MSPTAATRTTPDFFAMALNRSLGGLLAVMQATPPPSQDQYHGSSPGGGSMALAPTQSLVDTPSRQFYREAMLVLNRADVPFLVGGAFAFIHQAGIDKSTKDLDI